MSHLQQIEAFMAVVEHGSFVGAAKALGVSSSYVSKLVTRLEHRLGARLLQRTTRRQTLTSQGELYLEECQAAFQSLRRAEERLHESTAAIRGELRLTAPTALGLGILADLVHRFAAQHPGVQIRASYLDRRVDLIGERFDLAVRVGPLPDSSLRARRLGQYCRGVFAAPAVAEALGPISEPSALHGAQGLVYTGHTRPGVWTLHRGEQAATVTVQNRLEANSGRALALAAASGLGLTYLPVFHTEALVAEGRLIRLLPEWGETVPVHVVFPSSQHLPLRVRAFIDFVVTAMRET